MRSFEECEKEGKIRAVSEAKNWVLREVKSAEHRIKSAENVNKIGEKELVLLSAYNAILNLNRALVFSKGISVKGHLCLIKAIQKYFSKDKELAELSNSFERALESRNLVQYEGYLVNEEQAEFILSLAKDYLVYVKRLLKC
ncbi:MAG: HEPN domain-containing protein [Candidatus Diapherotrites archaeon]|nr:HEPN domain-containing protein [Candidatus Diapherotrites archaeon]